MIENEKYIVVAGCLGLLLVLGLCFGALHEKHYRDRRGEILSRRLAGMEHRLAGVENILTEDRLA